MTNLCLTLTLSHMFPGKPRAKSVGKKSKKRKRLPTADIKLGINLINIEKGA